LKSFAAKIYTKDKQIACFNAHIIPDNESFAPVNNNKNNLSEAEERNQNPSEGILKVIHIPGIINPSDAATKALASQLHQCHV
jgi:hypothetical protein